MRKRRDYSYVEKDGLGNHFLNHGKLDYKDNLFLREVCRTIDTAWDDLCDLLGVENVYEIPGEIFDIYADGLKEFCIEMSPICPSENSWVAMGYLGFLKSTRLLETLEKFKSERRKNMIKIMLENDKILARHKGEQP